MKVRKVMKLWTAQDGRCFLCGKEMLPTAARKQKSGMYDLGWTREHVLPRKLGGRNRDNIVLAHLKCNSERNHQPPVPGAVERCVALWKAAGLS